MNENGQNKREPAVRDVLSNVFADTSVSFATIFELMRAVEDGLDIQPLYEAGINPQQLRQVRLGLIGFRGEGLKSGDPIDLLEYAKQGLSSLQLEIIRRAFNEGLPWSEIANAKYNCCQMWELYQGLKAGVDIKEYADNSYNFLQMEQLRLGLQQGIGVKPYADKSLSASEMEKRRLILSGQLKKPGIAGRVKNAVRALKGKRYQGGE